jgi:hypothetical protein
MIQKNPQPQPMGGRLGILMGSLLMSLPMIPFSVTAAPTSAVNPCPRIYYEEPYNTTRIVPQGCPPNVATRTLQQQGQTSRQQGGRVPVPVAPGQATQPGTTPEVITTLPAAPDSVNISLRNDTNARISYQAVGQTEPRSLEDGEEVELQNLPTPATLTMTREDDGFIRVVPQRTNQPGALALSLNETANPDESQQTVRVQDDGRVIAY